MTSLNEMVTYIGFSILMVSGILVILVTVISFEKQIESKTQL